MAAFKIQMSEFQSVLGEGEGEAAAAWLDQADGKYDEAFDVTAYDKRVRGQGAQDDHVMAYLNMAEIAAQKMGLQSAAGRFAKARVQIANTLVTRITGLASNPVEAEALDQVRLNMSERTDEYAFAAGVNSQPNRTLATGHVEQISPDRYRIEIGPRGDYNDTAQRYMPKDGQKIVVNQTGDLIEPNPDATRQAFDAVASPAGLIAATKVGVGGRQIVLDRLRRNNDGTFEGRITLDPGRMGPRDHVFFKLAADGALQRWGKGYHYPRELDWKQV